jgi:hypothetical protein
VWTIIPLLRPTALFSLPGDSYSLQSHRSLRPSNPDGLLLPVNQPSHSSIAPDRGSWLVCPEDICIVLRIFSNFCPDR